LWLRDPKILEQMMAARGLDRTTLAAQVRTATGGKPSRQVISYMLGTAGHRGGRPRPTSRAIAQSVADVFGVEVEALFTDQPPHGMVQGDPPGPGGTGDSGPPK
jgi:hypothetical protein